MPLTPKSLARAAIAAILAAVVVWATIDASLENGRLQCFPRVDDVIYMARGAEWLRLARESGLGEVARAYAENPPHSPWGAGVAAIGFAVFGVQEWVPYAMGFIQVFIALLIGAILLRKTPWPGWLAGMITLACAPLLVAGVQNFKPDYFAAILTAGGILHALHRPIAKAGAWRSVLTGAIFGAALLVKPSIFALTLLLLGGSVGVAAVVDVLIRRRLELARHLRHGFSALLGCLAVASPHFVVAGPKVAQYMYDNMLGERSDLWAPDRTAAEHAAFFLTGPSGKVMLGPTLWVALVLIGIAAAVIVRRRRRAEVCMAMGMGCILFGTWLIPTLNWMKILTFGLTFQTLLAFVAVLSLAFLFRAQRDKPTNRRATLALGVVAAAVSLSTLSWRFPEVRMDVSDAGETTLRERDLAVRQAYDAALRALPSSNGLLGVSAPYGDLNVNLLTLWLVRDGQSARAKRVGHEPCTAAFSRVNTCDVMIVNDQMSAMNVERRTSGESLAAIRDRVRQSGEFELVERIAIPRSSAAIEIYRRIRTAE
jgi:hypothetical protein